MKLSFLAGALGLSLITAAAVAADNYTKYVSAETQRVYLKDDKGRVVVQVTNNSSETLDVDVSCIFYDKGKQKAGTGTGTSSRLPPHRSDTLDIADRQTLPFETAHCDVARAEK
jgi:opacity protein-like surface antigen